MIQSPKTFQENDRVLVSLTYQDSNEYDEEDGTIEIYDVTRWIIGKINNIVNNSYEVELSIIHLNFLELDPSLWSIIQINVQDHDKIREMSIENLIILLNAKAEVFDSEIDTQYLTELEFSQLVQLAVSVGNIDSLKWLFSKHILHPKMFKFDMNKVLLNSAKLNKVNIVVWVKENIKYPKQDVSWYDVFRVCDHEKRNIFHIAVALEKHHNFIFDLIDEFEYRNFDDNDYGIKDIIMTSMVRFIDLEGNSCIHLAALNGEILSIMNILISIVEKVFQDSREIFYYYNLEQELDKVGTDFIFDSIKNIFGQTVSDIVYATCNADTIEEYKLLCQQLNNIITTQRITVKRISLIRSNDSLVSRGDLPYFDNYDFTDRDYENIIFDALVDKSFSFEDYFYSKIYPYISHEWKGFNHLFYKSIALGHFNKAKLLFELNLIDRNHINTSFDFNGRTAVENACYGNWWRTRDLLFWKKNNSEKVIEESIQSLFYQWDENIIEKTKSLRNADGLYVEPDFKEMSLWNALDTINKVDIDSNNNHSYSFIDNRTYYKDIKPRGSIKMLLWLLKLSCNYPTCRFVISHCDKYMAEWYIRYRILIRDMLIDQFGDLHDLISSYLFVDYIECRDSILKKVLTVPIIGNNEKSLYLLDMLLTKFKVDPYLKNIRGIKKSESILYLSIQNENYMCVKYLINNFDFLLDSESLKEGMLPINYAIQIAENDEKSAMIALFIISVELEKLKSNLQYHSLQYHSHIQYQIELKKLLLEVTDSKGRTTKDFCLNNNDFLEMKAVAMISDFGSAYIDLTNLIENDESLESIIECCESKGGRLLFEQFNIELMDYKYEFGTREEQMFLFVCLSKGRIDVIEWYYEDMYRDENNYDEETNISKVTLWRFNSLDVNKLDGRGIFHGDRSQLNRWTFSDSITKEAFYKQYSAKYIAQYYNQLEMFNFIEELDIEFEEKGKLIEFIYRSEEVAKLEGPCLYSDKVSLLNSSGFRPAILKGLSIVEIEIELQKGLELKQKFRDSLKLEQSKLLFDNRCNSNMSYILNSGQLFDNNHFPDIISYCLANNFDHIIKWIAELMSVESIEMDEFFSHCMIDAISCGRVDFIDYLDSVGVSFYDKPFENTYSSYIVAAACHLEFDIFKHYYEGANEIDRPSMELILTKMIYQNRRYFPYQKRLFGYRSQINEYVINHIKVKSNNRKRFFEYFVSIGMLDYNSSTEILSEIISVYTTQSESSERDSGFVVSSISIDLIYYLVEEIGLDISNSHLGRYYIPNQSLIDLAQKKKSEARLINSIQRGDTIQAIQKLEIETSIDVRVVRTRDGIPMLHFATSFAQIHIVKWLLSTKSDLNIREIDKLGRTALSIAQELQSNTLIQLLEECNINN